MAAITLAVVGLLIDFLLFALPIAAVFQLQMTPKAKLQSVAPFFLGGLYVSLLALQAKVNVHRFCIIPEILLICYIGVMSSSADIARSMGPVACFASVQLSTTSVATNLPKTLFKWRSRRRDARENNERHTGFHRTSDDEIELI
jgi:hypothetical protein